MKLLSWSTLVSAGAALALLVLVVAGIPEWRIAVLHLQLPLEFPDGEESLAFLPSIALATLATLMGLPAWHQRVGRAGLAVAFVTWFALIAVIGVRGFTTLF